MPIHPKQQTLDEIVDGVESVEVVEEEIDEQYPLSQEDSTALAHMQPVHTGDIIAWMSQQADMMPDLDSYDEKKAVSYDMEKIKWEAHQGKPLRFHLFGVQWMSKPDKLTREEKEMETVILRNREGIIFHDSKAILVDKCKTILKTRNDDKPIPVIITYIGTKPTKSGQEAPNFDVRTLKE